MEELKKKIDEAMKCQFVGEVIFTEDELAKIYSFGSFKSKSQSNFSFCF